VSERKDRGTNKKDPRNAYDGEKRTSARNTEIKELKRRTEKRKGKRERERERRVATRNERMETKIVPATRNEGKTHSVCSLAALSCSIVRRPTIV